MSQPLQGTKDEPRLVWALAVPVAALGTWVLFDARPGINWVLWTGAAVAGLSVLTIRRNPPASLPVLALVSVLIAGAAAVTSNQETIPLICLSIVFLLALQMLLASRGSLRTLTVVFAAIAPLIAFMTALIQATRRVVEATNLIRSDRARGWVRGLAITLPVLIVFTLLLAEADPVFASWRDGVSALLANWDFVPRGIFFGFLMVVVLGAYGYASRESERVPLSEGLPMNRWLGMTERLLLMGGIAGLFWLFLAVQLGYLFGNLPQMAASGVTFAEYARRGFGELTVVASASALLIVGSELFGKDHGRAGLLRFFTFAVIAAVLLLLGSAFRRVLLYEAAYGFTTARLYAQVYMGAVAAGLVVLALEVARQFDPGRLFRRAAAAALVLFIGLIYWNHEAWIARQNIDRFASTGQLDIPYLAKELSPDAIPAIGERLASLPEPARDELRLAVLEQSTRRKLDKEPRWFEWNRSRSRAREVLAERFKNP